MPKISKKGMAMPSSPIRKLVPYAEAAKARGVKVYHLNIGQPDIKTPEVALNAVKGMKDTVIAYSHSAGNISYRKKLVEHYKKIGLELTPEDIIVTNGGSEAITISFMSTLNEGDEVIIPEPFYANYNGFAIQTGVVIKPITSSIKNDFGLPALEEFEKLITPKTKGIVICNPNNPTGYLYSKEELYQLAEIVKKHDLFLYADEVYREFCYDGNTHLSVLNIPGLEQHAIMLDSVSKRYSMCGVRVGWIVSKNKEVMATAMKFAQARLCPPSLGQIAAEAAIDTPDSYFEEVYNEYIARRNFMVAELNKIPGVYAQWLLEDFEYNKQTVMLAPATGFYNTPGLGKNEVRIAYVLKIEDIKNAIETLRKALEVYPGRV
jgi:aspartate aminotransferase